MIGNVEYLNEEEREMLESTIVLAGMFDYSVEKSEHGVYFTLSKDNKRIFFSVYPKKIKLRVIENNIMWQRKSKSESTRARMKLIKRLQKQF